GMELNMAFGANSYILSSSNVPLQLFPDQPLKLIRSIFTDEDGNDQISYYNSSGQIVAKCLNGTSSTSIQENLYVEKPIEINVQASQLSSINIPKVISTSGGVTTPIYKIEDLRTGRILDEGIDYSFSTGVLVFS